MNWWRDVSVEAVGGLIAGILIVVFVQSGNSSDVSLSPDTPVPAYALGIFLVVIVFLSILNTRLRDKHWGRMEARLQKENADLQALLQADENQIRQESAQKDKEIGTLKDRIAVIAEFSDEERAIANTVFAALDDVKPTNAIKIAEYIRDKYRDPTPEPRVVQVIGKLKAINVLQGSSLGYIEFASDWKARLPWGTP